MTTYLCVVGVTERTDHTATDRTAEGLDTLSEADKVAESRRSIILQKFSPKLIKSILELLCDETVSVKHLTTYTDTTL